jgi:hypothetical protein
LAREGQVETCPSSFVRYRRLAPALPFAAAFFFPDAFRATGLAAAFRAPFFFAGADFRFGVAAALAEVFFFATTVFFFPPRLVTAFRAFVTVALTCRCTRLTVLLTARRTAGRCFAAFRAAAPALSAA